jgi:hypothetical protein
MAKAIPIPTTSPLRDLDGTRVNVDAVHLSAKKAHCYGLRAHTAAHVQNADGIP